MHYFFSLHFHSCPAKRHGIQWKYLYSNCTGCHWGGLQVLTQHWTENIALEDQVNFLNLLHSLLLIQMQFKVVKRLCVLCHKRATNSQNIWFGSMAFQDAWWFSHLYSSCPLKKIHPFPTIHNDKRITQRSSPFNLNGQTEEYFLHTSTV